LALVTGRRASASRTRSADLADVERRHAEYFRALVENADWPTERQAEWAERLQTDEENLRIAIRWFLTHDIAPLPHMFRILWLFWQMRGRMPEGRGWTEDGRLAVQRDGGQFVELLAILLGEP
jgi:predicted ATPase